MKNILKTKSALDRLFPGAGSGSAWLEASSLSDKRQPTQQIHYPS